MQLFLDGMAVPLRAATARQVILSSDGVRLRLVLAAGEELREAMLALRRDDSGDVPSFPPAAVTTSRIDGGLTGISWIALDWGSARALRSFSLMVASASGLRVRIQIARSGGSWFPPPGPHVFDVTDGSTVALEASLPEAVAERALLEFLGSDQGQPRTVTLSSAPMLYFGGHARDIGLRFVQGRDFFENEGELDGKGRVVPDLLGQLRRQLGELEGPAEIELELHAGVAGAAGFEWAFDSADVVRRWGDGREVQERLLPWGEPVRLELPLPPMPAMKQLEALDLVLEDMPLPERLALVPERLSSTVALWCRPLLDHAQPLTVVLSSPLTGIDLWARCLTPRLRARVLVVPDVGGRPVSEMQGAVGVMELDDESLPQQGASWFPVTFSMPVSLPAGTWWVIVLVDEGELLWFLSDVPEVGVGTPRYRQNQGAWIERVRSEAGNWGQVRLHVQGAGEVEPIEARLFVGVVPVPLMLTGDGRRIRWRRDAGAPAGVGAPLGLELRSGSARRVTLSGLRLVYHVPADG